MRPPWLVMSLSCAISKTSTTLVERHKNTIAAALVFCEGFAGTSTYQLFQPCYKVGVMPKFLLKDSLPEFRQLVFEIERIPLHPSRNTMLSLRFLSWWLIEMTETWKSALQHLAILEKLALSINIDLTEAGLHGDSLRSRLNEKLQDGSLKYLALRNDKSSNCFLSYVNWSYECRRLQKLSVI